MKNNNPVITENLPELPEGWIWADREVYSWSCTIGLITPIYAKWIAIEKNKSFFLSIRLWSDSFNITNINEINNIPTEQLLQVLKALLDANNNGYSSCKRF